MIYLKRNFIQKVLKDIIKKEYFNIIMKMIKFYYFIIELKINNNLCKIMIYILNHILMNLNKNIQIIKIY